MNGKIYVYTSAACNYIPKVRLLVKSIRKFHPEMRIVLAMADELDEPDLVEEVGGDEILPLATLGIPNWRRWAFTHEIVELSTAIKPFALLNLLEREDCAGVLYIDPDMVLFSRLDDLLAEFDHSDVLLTPHQTKQETELGAVMDNEISSLKHGIYNLGFLGVRASDNGRAFAKWWADRVYYFCRDEIHNGLFTDQRWVDLAPALFDGVNIVRSPRFNVATWNITTRKLTGDLDAGFKVDGNELGFYHFTGFDSGAHRIMAGKYAAANSAAHRLIDWYERETAGWQEDRLARQPWAYGYFSDGEPISRACRLIYRNRPDLQEAYPDPFAADRGDESTLAGWFRLNAASAYPDLFPVSGGAIDLSPLMAFLVPSVAPPDGTLPGVRDHLMRAAFDPRHRRVLTEQTLRVVRREGFSGLWTRLKRLARR